MAGKKFAVFVSKDLIYNIDRCKEETENGRQSKDWKAGGLHADSRVRISDKAMSCTPPLSFARTLRYPY